jgi:hypothetical protein
VKCKDYWTERPISNVLTPSQIPDAPEHIKYVENNLTKIEIQSAQKGDLFFMNAEKHELEKWDAELQRRFNIVLENPRMPRIEYYQMPAWELCNLLNMPKRPIAPASISLRCWHEQWDSKNDNDILQNLPKHCCCFYYPVSKKGGKSFDGCYREQQDNKLNRNMLIAILTLGATIIGILVAILLRFV